MKCTVIIPCHNEETNVQPLYSAIIEIVGDDPDFDILFVDDGSSDKTLDQIKECRRIDRRVKFISLLTNYGHQKALMAGLMECKNGNAISMDGDLQHPPRFIPIFIEEHEKTGADIVIGRRKTKQEGFGKRLFSAVFYRLFRWLTGFYIPPDTSDFRLYSRKAIDILCSIRDTDPFLRGLISRLNLPTRIVDYDLEQRYSGSPSYTFVKSMRMALNSLLRFSALPYRLGILTGVVGICMSVLLASNYIYARLFTNTLVPGQADLMIFLGAMSSLILLMMSFLLKIVCQIRNSLMGDPSYLISEKKTTDQDSFPNQTNT